MNSTAQVDWLEHVKTEPLSRDELATHFQVSSKHVGPMVDAMSGTQRIGRKWRVLVKNMPPSYWLSCGLIIPMQPDTQGLPRTHGIQSATYSMTSDRRNL
jgi:hypothetical protein